MAVTVAVAAAKLEGFDNGGSVLAFIMTLQRTNSEPKACHELHQLRMDEEALKEMLEEEAMNKKAQKEKIRQEQAENNAFFLEFGVVSPFKLETFALNSSVLFAAWVKKGTKIKMSYLVPLIAVVFVVVVGCYLACVPQEEDHQYLVVILGLIVPLIIVAIGVEVFWKK
ncbi:hypothetical protein Tco_0782172 [Tanacetum coccineum]